MIESLVEKRILGFIGILLVVFGHANAPFAGQWSNPFSFNSNFLNFIGNYVYSFHMPLFVFISGYLFCYLRECRNKYTSINLLILKKINRLIIPYILLAPIYILLFKDMELLNSIFAFFKGVGHLWFLLMLFGVFILSYFLEKYLESKTKKFLICLLLFFMSPYISKYTLGLFCIDKSMKFLIYFYLGIVFFRGKETLYNSSIVKYMILFHLIMYIGAFVFISNLYVKYIMQLCLGISGSIMCWYLCMLVVNNKSFNKGKSRLITENSYGIYLFHQPIIIALNIYLFDFYKYLGSPYLVVIFNFILSVLLSICISLLLRKVNLSIFLGEEELSSLTNFKIISKVVKTKEIPICIKFLN